MRWGRLYVQSLILSLVLITAIAHALEMEYISPTQKQQLVTDFEQAKAEKTEALLDKKWSCDMYGVRSRLQVQRAVKLYSLSKNASGAIVNTGAQVVSEYKLEKGILSGQKGQFQDDLRVTSSGQLMSRLTVKRPEPMVIAYSVCTAL